MTGVGDVLVAVRTAARRNGALKPLAVLVSVFETIVTLTLPIGAASAIIAAITPDWHRIELRRALSKVGPRLPPQHVPDGRQSLRLLEQQSLEVAESQTEKEMRSLSLADESKKETRRIRDTCGGRWAFLLPLTSRQREGETTALNFEETLWKRLKYNLDLLVSTSTRLRSTSVYVAIDLRDPVFDNSEAREHIRILLRGFKEVVFMEPMVPAFQGALCWIWAAMAKRAVDDGVDYFILLGDDVEVKNNGWQEDVEECFEDVARERNLPHGCACVALRDDSFEGFPTFPVIHRFHMDAFHGQLFPPEFRNQHGDPFLFEIYRRFGASRFTKRSNLVNTVGGAGEARYAKANQLTWRANILTRAIDRMTDHIRNLVGEEVVNSALVPCINVVIPTYRCEVDSLRALSNLECRRDASVSTIILVDRPDADAETLNDVRALASYAPNRVVRVVVMSANGGASAARNEGLAQSFGDYCVLLDDDVVPCAGLLDAYLGAIERQPGAAAYVGVTSLPPPLTFTQRALAASRICYFYGIAAVIEKPPWGVTANLCVKGRTNNSVVFSHVYPRTGGGEDVDYCIRSQMLGHGGLVAVPGARVIHPFWKFPLNQVRGWAAGDVLCLDTLAHRGFRTLPNWAEYSLLFFTLALICVILESWTLAESFVCFALIAIATEIAMLLPRFYANAGDVTANCRVRITAALLGVLPPMLQDGTRLASKLRRLRLSKVCTHFDWMNGTGRHVQEMQLTLAVKNLVFWAACISRVPPSSIAKVELVQLEATAPIALLVFYSLWGARQAGLFSAFQPRMLRGPMLRFHIDPVVKPFVVLAYQRTGSNLLCGYLSAIQGIFMNFELYNEKAIYGANGKMVCDPALLRRRDEDPCQFLKDTLDKHSVSHASVGFKLFPEHITRGRNGSDVLYDFFERLLADPRIKKVVLKRENRAATCASVLRSSITGSFVRKNLDHVQVHIKPTDLHEFVQGYDKYYEFVEERLAGQQWIDVTYETLVEKTESELQRVCRFLGVRVGIQAMDVGVEKSVPKQTSRPLKALIKNFAELRSAFAGTGREIDFIE